jgi:hypothetical protein
MTNPILATSPDFASPIARAVNSLIETRPEIVPVPVTSASAGTSGQIAFDATHLYFCVATDTWKRALLSTF